MVTSIGRVIANSTLPDLCEGHGFSRLKQQDLHHPGPNLWIWARAANEINYSAPSPSKTSPQRQPATGEPEYFIESPGERDFSKVSTQARPRTGLFVGVLPSRIYARFLSCLDTSCLPYSYLTGVTFPAAAETIFAAAPPLLSGLATGRAVEVAGCFKMIAVLWSRSWRALHSGYVH